MAYTNTWIIYSPQSSDDWTDMDDELRKLKVDMNERVWEDGLHMNDALTEPSLSVDQLLVSTANLLGRTLMVKSGSGYPLSLIDDGEIYPGIIVDYPDIMPIDGGILDDSDLMKALMTQEVSFTINSGSLSSQTPMSVDIDAISDKYIGSTLFWDDGSAFICKRDASSASKYKFTILVNSGGVELHDMSRGDSSTTIEYFAYVIAME